MSYSGRHGCYHQHYGNRMMLIAKENARHNAGRVHARIWMVVMKYCKQIPAFIDAKHVNQLVRSSGTVFCPWQLARLRTKTWHSTQNDKLTVLTIKWTHASLVRGSSTVRKGCSNNVLSIHCETINQCCWLQCTHSNWIVGLSNTSTDFHRLKWNCKASCALCTF